VAETVLRVLTDFTDIYGAQEIKSSESSIWGITIRNNWDMKESQIGGNNSQSSVQSSVPWEKLRPFVCLSCISLRYFVESMTSTTWIMVGTVDGTTRHSDTAL